MSWKWKPLGFFMLKLPPSPPQLSSQNNSVGGSPWSCLRTPPFSLHPLDCSLLSLLRQSEVNSPSAKLLLETNPSICSRIWGARWIPSLPKRYSSRNSLGRKVWVYWPYLRTWIHSVTQDDAILVYLNRSTYQDISWFFLMVRHASLKHCNLVYMFVVISIYILLEKNPKESTNKEK